MSAMCRVLDVSTSGYYAARQRPGSARAKRDAALTQAIVSIHGNSRGTYGAPRIHAELRLEQGQRCSRKRVARLMRQAGLRGCHRRRPIHTTRRSPGASPAPDLVQRNFQVDRPDRLWVADITYIRTWAGFLFLAVIVDACSRAVVGWAMGSDLRTELVLQALEMALWRRRPAGGVVHHSDQGSQYTSLTFGERLRQAGLLASMGSVGDCYDNAMAESFFASLECELLDRQHFLTREAARMAVFDYIEGFYNPRRRHSALGYLSPLEFERRLQLAG